MSRPARRSTGVALRQRSGKVINLWLFIVLLVIFFAGLGVAAVTA